MQWQTSLSVQLGWVLWATAALCSRSRWWLHNEAWDVASVNRTASGKPLIGNCLRRGRYWPNSVRGPLFGEPRAAPLETARPSAHSARVIKRLVGTHVAHAAFNLPFFQRREEKDKLSTIQTLGPGKRAVDGLMRAMLCACAGDRSSKPPASNQSKSVGKSLSRACSNMRLIWCGRMRSLDKSSGI